MPLLQRWMLLCAGLLWTGSTWAEDTSLWWARGVTHYSDGRLEASELQPLLAEVIVRAGGSIDCLSQPAVEQALQHPGDYVRSHSLLAPTATAAQEQAVEFDAGALRALLQQAACPCRPPQRVLVLWLHGGQLAPMPPALAAPLLHEMSERGMHPLLGNESVDLTQSLSLFTAPASLWRDLTHRSGAQALLLLNDDGQQVVSQLGWRWLSDDQELQSSLPVEHDTSAWPRLADMVAELIAARRQLPQLPTDRQELHIDGIQGLADWIALRRELQRQGYTTSMVVYLQGEKMLVLDTAPWGHALHDSRYLQQVFPDQPWVDARQLQAWRDVWPVHVLRWLHPALDERP